MANKRPLADSPDDTETAFYDALGRADLDGLMALWADDDEIVCVHPGAPRLIGHAAIRASWQSIFEQGGVPIHAVQLHVLQNPTAATHSVIEQLRGDAEVRQQDRHIVATNVYVKTALGWRIAVHHASLAPGNAPPDDSVSTTLH